jgi:CxxC motif-containing protein (DUF1111 family)
MKRPYLGWYILVAVLVLAPGSLRLLSWRMQRPHEVDATMAQAGHALFVHEWKPNDPLSPEGDGLGPVFNATSCVACHHQGRVGGSGDNQHNVTTFTIRPERNNGLAREGVIHAHAVNGVPRESLALVKASLPEVSQQQILVPNGRKNLSGLRSDGVHVSQRNTPALFGAKLIDDLPERLIIATERGQHLKWGMRSSKDEQAPVGRALRLGNGKVGRFGWKAQTASLSDFVQAACANELGLGNPGQAQPLPMGRPDYRPRGLDLTLEQCDQLTAYVASLPRPVERLTDDAPAAREARIEGKKLFKSIGCAECHMENLGSVEGLYSDLLLHRMGQPLEGGGSYNDPPRRLPDFPSEEGPQPGEWRTPPLWGVADSAPYLHDGRAKTLLEAIGLHGGQGEISAKRFAGLSQAEQGQLLAFLNSLRAPGPGD